MKRFSTFPLLVAVFVIAIAACSSYKASTAGGPELPPADAQALYKYITATNNYQNWDLWPGKGKQYKGQPPHGAFLTTYVNKAGLGAIGAGKTMGDGSIVVKENYSPEKMLGAVTVMYKVKGFNPDAGNWFWVKYKGDGTVLKSGKVGGCINCHSAKKSNDFIFTSTFVK